MGKVQTGLDRLTALDPGTISGNIALLCHSASVDSELCHALAIVESRFGDRFTKIFSPQHGLVSDVQDNMVETSHSIHPYYKRPIYSLYSETREPTSEMLEDIDVVVVDLQDVGCRIYTYVYTMALTMKACAERGIQVIVLDRPNPIGGKQIEGNLLDTNFSSFVGMFPIPVRHGLTIGEFALMTNKCWQPDCELKIVEMQGWNREMYFNETDLPWVLPSPNMPTWETALPFVGTVLFEGTNISEGRGTTKSLELVGHPSIEPFSFLESLTPHLQNLSGFVLRPVSFLPTFQKHANQPCGGFQIHVTDRQAFQPWQLCQLLMREFFHHLGEAFAWKQPPYEYEYEKAPIDMINGTDQLREWIVRRGEQTELDAFEQTSFRETRKPYLLY